MQIDGEGEPDAIPAARKSAGKSNDGVNESPLLRLDNITKYFHELCANDSISLDVYPGQIHALLGENGAGKSTLVKIILGALRPDGGRAYWQGAPLAPSSPADARQLGIGMVFQHFSLFESLTVFENLALTLPKSQQRNRRELSNTIRETAQSYGLHINLDAIVGGISAGERQRVEIIRCLIQHPKLIIMDEPTSVLTPQEAEHLFEVLRRLAAEGTSVLYISHRLDEVRQLCSWATILRQGKVVTRCDPRQETPQSLAQKMVGSEVVDPTRPANIQKTVRLHIDNLSYQRQTEHGVALNNISLVVLAGEIVGIAGIAGNGQSELFDCLSGERAAPKSTSINFDGKDVGALGVNARRKLGAVFVPEERHGHSAAADLALEKNCLLTRHATGEDFIKRGAIDKPFLQKVTARIIGEYDVRFHGHNPPARALSGGNLQKFVLGRELDRNPGIVIVNQPSWGVDAGVAALIRQKLIDLAASGSAILMISQDLDEILMISNRIAVISRGNLSDALPSDTVNREKIGLMMASGNMSGGVGAAGASPNSASHPAANLNN